MVRPDVGRAWRGKGVVMCNTAAGVWVVYCWDWNADISRLCASEIEAYRAAEQWEQVKFVPFGVDVTETLLKTAASASPQRVEACGARSVTPAADRAAHLNNEPVPGATGDGLSTHQERTLMDQLATLANPDFKPLSDDGLLDLLDATLRELNRRAVAKLHPAGSDR